MPLKRLIVLAVLLAPAPAIPEDATEILARAKAASGGPRLGPDPVEPRPRLLLTRWP